MSDSGFDDLFEPDPAWETELSPDTGAIPRPREGGELAWVRRVLETGACQVESVKGYKVVVRNEVYPSLEEDAQVILYHDGTEHTLMDPRWWLTETSLTAPALDTSSKREHYYRVRKDGG